MVRKYIFLSSFFLCFSQTIFSQWLQISPNNRYLRKDNGEPFFWLGDTSWELIHKLDSSEVIHYLNVRKQQGFNVIQTVALAEFNGVETPNANGALPLIDYDPEKPNEPYFEFVDFVIQEAAKRDMYVALEPTWGIHVVYLPWLDNRKVFNPENAYPYGKWLGERYKDTWNVVWMLGGDSNPIPGVGEIWEALAVGLKEGDDGKHLLTYQPNGYSSTVDFIHDKPWLDFNGIQVGHKRRNNADADFVRKGWEKTPVKPVLNLESTYEGITVGFHKDNGYFNDYDIRKSAYWSVFSGSLGYTYGNNSVWQMHIPDEPGRYDSQMTWSEALHAPGANNMKHLRDLMESRPQLTRVPSQDLIMKASSQEPAAGHQSDRVVAISDIRDNTGTYILVYSPQKTSLKINTSHLGKELNISWFNPRSGEMIFTEMIENESTFETNARKYPPGGPDWVLIIDDASIGYTR